MIHFSTHNQKGFSLVETLFAIAILMIALVGPMTLAWSSLSASSDQRNEVTASYLAQESLEYIKNFRDTATLQSDADFSVGLGNCLTTNGCDARPVGSTIMACPAGGCQLYLATLASGDSFYTSDETAGTTHPPSPFTRKIILLRNYNGHADETLVTVTLGWKNHAVDRTLEINEVLYNLN